MSEREKYRAYEVEKGKLQKQNLPPDEYQKRLRTLAKKLKI